MNQIELLFVTISGFVLLFAATDVYRPNDKIKFLSFSWFLRLVLLIAGSLCIVSIGPLS